MPPRLMLRDGDNQIRMESPDAKILRRFQQHLTLGKMQQPFIQLAGDVIGKPIHHRPRKWRLRRKGRPVGYAPRNIGVNQATFNRPLDPSQRSNARMGFIVTAGQFAESLLQPAWIAGVLLTEPAYLPQIRLRA